MNIELLLQIAWSVAAHEARTLGSPSVEPLHFLLAALKIADPAFPSKLEEDNMPTETWKSICKEAVRLRHYLDIPADKVAGIRHRLRHRLARAAKQPLTPSKKVHRSRKTRAAFFDAHSQLNSESITLVQLMRSMFELDFLDVSDMRWRGETQTKAR